MNEKMKKIFDVLSIIIMILVILLVLYYILGMTGLLPKAVYEACENITLQQAQKRGCCEDRDMRPPVSWMFGTRTCDKYRINNSEELK